MSTKRGRRNGKWHKEKQTRRILEYRDSLWEDTRLVEYIPLEKPVFAGWDISLYVEGERKDKPELEAVAAALSWSKAFFIRDVSKIKVIRGFRRGFHGYQTVKNSYFGGVDYSVYQSVYNKLPDRVKEYFQPIVRVNIYGQEYNTYLLKWGFPFYAFKVKIEKSYFFYRGIPNSQAQSEYDKLGNLNYENLQKYWGRYSWRDDYKKSIKTAWKNALTEIVSKQMREEELLDYKYQKCWDKKPFGWS